MSIRYTYSNNYQINWWKEQIQEAKCKICIKLPNDDAENAPTIKKQFQSHLDEVIIKYWLEYFKFFLWKTSS